MASAAGQGAGGAAVTAGSAAPPADKWAAPNSMRGDALTDAYDALTRADYSNIQGIIAGIDRYRDANPDNAYGYLYAGIFRLWAAADSGGAGLLAAPDIVTGTIENLSRAHEMLPNDFRASGFLGVSQVLFGQLAAGLETLQESVDQFPEYGHFLRGYGTGSLASTDPNFKKYGVNDMVADVGACMLETDASGAWVYPKEGHPKYGQRVCTNAGIVPHVWEGWFMTFGDLAVKAGWSKERVSAVYRTAQNSPVYDQWPFKRDLEQRIANVMDGNPVNDAAVVGRICSSCHQK